MVGTQNAHNVISVSSDGKLCSWSLDMLSQPQDILELNHKYDIRFKQSFLWNISYIPSLCVKLKTIKLRN